MKGFSLNKHTLYQMMSVSLMQQDPTLLNGAFKQLKGEKVNKEVEKDYVAKLEHYLLAHYHLYFTKYAADADTVSQYMKDLKIPFDLMESAHFPEVSVGYLCPKCTLDGLKWLCNNIVDIPDKRMLESKMMKVLLATMFSRKRRIKSGRSKGEKARKKK